MAWSVCLLIPGTIIAHKQVYFDLVNPADRTFEVPTGLITLTAGEYKVCLSDMFRESVEVVERIERMLDRFIRDQGLQQQHAGADLIVVTYVQLEPGEQQSTS